MIGEKDTPASFVYFIKSGDYLKIGITTNIDARLEQFRTSNPIIELLALVRGGRKEEQELHQQFQEYRLKREWFRYTDKLKNFVENMGMPGPPKPSFKPLGETWLDHINATIQRQCKDAAADIDDRWKAYCTF